MIYPSRLREGALLLSLLSSILSTNAATKLMDYCSPPGPHVPYVSTDTLRNSPFFGFKMTEVTSFLQKISDDAEFPLIHRDSESHIGGVNLAVAITTTTDTVYTFNHGLKHTPGGEDPWTEHTIFRVASVSKALTVWEVVKLGIGWQEKVVHYLPELAVGRYKAEWSDITVGALAGYVGGAIRDSLLRGMAVEHDISQRPGNEFEHWLWKRGHEGSSKKKNGYFIPEDTIQDIDGYVESIWTTYLPEFQPSEAWKMGFPPLEDIERDACFGNCTRKEFLNMLANHPLVYPAYTNPAYSNVGFSLLGLILERKTGLSFESLMQRDMYVPLGMKDTFHRLPNDAPNKPEGWGAHPYWGANDTWWETREIWGDWGVPAGGIFTSAHDLAIFLRTILAAFPYANDPKVFPNKYSVLSSARVREWLTPTAFTGGKTMLGRPWEIQRKKFAGCHGDRPITIYSKAGGGTGYNAGITIIPELGIGITILVAGDGGKFTAPNGISYSYHWKTIQRALLEDKGLLQTFERAAYQEAERQYLGEYLFNSFMLDGDDGTNPPLPYKNLQSAPIFSGLELIKDNGPGLRIKRWISNGTDFLQTLVKVKLQMNLKGVEGAVAVARAYPVGNIRSRGPERWAEDWRVWFEWEWENLPEDPTQTPRGPIYRSQASPLQKGWNREKSRTQSNTDSSINVPWKVYPEILPGDHERRRNPDRLQGQDPVPSAEDEMEDNSSIRRKGWAKPTKSSATTASSEDDAQTWSNNPKRPWWRAKTYGGRNQGRRKGKIEEWVFPEDEEVDQQLEDSKIGKENKDHFRAYMPVVADNGYRAVSPALSGERPMWWRDKFDSNEDLKKYRERKEYNSNEEQEDGEGESTEGDKEAYGKTDRVINYTYKKAEAHGAGMPNDTDDEEEEEYDDLDGIWFEKRGLDDSEMGSEGMLSHIHIEYDSDDEDFFIPDHPPHAAPIPMVFDQPFIHQRDSQDSSFWGHHSDQYSDDDIYSDNHQGGPNIADMSPPHEKIRAQWNRWKETEEGRKAEEKKNQRNKWPCSDYNGIELQAWAGWSLGVVRFLREGSDRRVVGMEVPSLKIRLGKVGTVDFWVSRRSGEKNKGGESDTARQRSQKTPPQNVHGSPRGGPWRVVKDGNIENVSEEL